MINALPTTETAEDLEVMAQALERSGGYRVLRRLAPLARREPPAGVQTRHGLFVDTETTGLDPARDEIIELAMVPFTYGVDGEIYAIGEAFQQLRQPTKPIPPEVTASPSTIASSMPPSTANSSSASAGCSTPNPGLAR